MILYRVFLKAGEAFSVRDVLFKFIYSRLFDYIVVCVNKVIFFFFIVSYIGLLDIVGFGE